MLQLHLNETGGIEFWQGNKPMSKSCDNKKLTKTKADILIANVSSFIARSPIARSG
jgi:hypothetical protein